MFALRTASTVKAFAGAHRSCGTITCGPTPRVLPSGNRTLGVRCVCGEAFEIPVAPHKVNDDFLGLAVLQTFRPIRVGLDAMVVDRFLDDHELLPAVRTAIDKRVISLVMSYAAEQPLQQTKYPRRGRLLGIVQSELRVELLGFDLISDAQLDALTTSGRGGRDDALIAASTAIKADVFVTADQKLLRKVVKASATRLLQCEGWGAGRVQGLHIRRAWLSPSALRCRAVASLAAYERVLEG